MAIKWQPFGTSGHAGSVTRIAFHAGLSHHEIFMTFSNVAAQGPESGQLEVIKSPIPLRSFEIVRDVRRKKKSKLRRPRQANKQRTPARRILCYRRHRPQIFLYSFRPIQALRNGRREMSSIGTSKTKHHSLQHVHYPFWFGGSASCFAAAVTHPLDLSMRIPTQMRT